MDSKDIAHVNKAIAESYRKLRTRIGVIALAFPLVLIAVGYYWGIGIKPTLSDYYYAKDPIGDRIDIYPIRLWFCGILFIVGAFLYKYEGFSVNENRWLSLAGFFALGVAVFPMSLDGKSDFGFFAWLGLPQLSLHGISAVLAFVCIAVVILWYSDLTLSELKKANPDTAKRYKKYYRGIGIYMVLAIGVSVILHYAFGKKGIYILLAETSGIWAFAAYWFVKNKELYLVAQFLESQGMAKPHEAQSRIEVPKAM
jgi:hypothetical protein